MLQPQVVMPQIGDELTFSLLQAAVVRAGLVPGIDRQIDPPHPRVFGTKDHLFRIIGAAITDDKKLEISHGLRQYAGNGATKHLASIVGGNDHCDAR